MNNEKQFREWLLKTYGLSLFTKSGYKSICFSKIYINNIKIENDLGITITAENLCQFMGIPESNAIVSDEDMNEIPFGKQFQV